MDGAEPSEVHPLLDGHPEADKSDHLNDSWNKNNEI
jgi:hypothetical protein